MSFNGRKNSLDTTVIFRWRYDYEKALRDYATSRRLTISQLLRQFLDGFVVRQGLVKK